MKTVFILGVILFSRVFCFAQNNINSDSLVVVICQSLMTDESDDADTTKLFRALFRHVSPVVRNIKEDSANQFINLVDLRLQRQCPLYSNIIEKWQNSRKSDWESVDIEPNSKVTENEFNSLFQQKNLSYLEANGDTVKLNLTDSTWKDNFRNGTYSFLSLRKTNKNEFIIKFISSNHETRSKFSKVGDEYRYRVIEKTSDYYVLTVQPMGVNRIMKFKLYY